MIARRAAATFRNNDIGMKHQRARPQTSKVEVSQAPVDFRRSQHFYVGEQIRRRAEGGASAKRSQPRRR